MKKTITLAAALILSLSALAKEHPEKYCAQLRDGKKTIMHEGIPLVSEVMLANGTKIQPDGTVIKTDGSKIMLKEGECISKDGVIAPENGKKNK
jgi:hypothetical protein